ncbi:MAG: S8 family serine peptidase [Pseudomonadota bacterium]
MKKGNKILSGFRYLCLSFVIGMGLVTIVGTGGGGGGNPEEPLTTSTPSDLDWTVPQTIPENICALSTGEEISSEIIAISVKDNVNKEAVEDIASGINGTIIGELPDIKAYYIKFDSPKMGIEIESIIDQLRLNPNIETASPEYIYEINEPFPSITDIETPGLLTDDQKWGFTRINMPQAWDAIRSSGKELANVIVAVIDTGVDLTHPDLENNLALEVNGYKAWDFGDNDQDVSYDSLSLCLKGDHGTNISGIIASIINGEGINGVSPTAKLFPLKYWPSIWKTSWDCKEGKKKAPAYAVAYAVYWAVLAGVDVINLSLGGYLDLNEYKQTVEYKVIKKALERDIIVVAAAGNDGKDASNFFPSALDGVISVGATDINDERSIWSASSSSNYSDFPNSLWVAAPGTDVYTTDVTTFFNYEYVNGTSIATPFVSGLAAFIKQVNPSLTNIEIANTIRSTARDVSVTYPDESNHTWKMINAFKAVTTILEEMKENTPPTATITSPTNGDSFTEGDEITFAGTATDPEDGQLTGNSLIWTSDKDGQIGTGQSFTKSNLSVNTHTITLTAKDSEGATGTDSITITVASTSCSDPHEPNDSFAQARYLGDSQGSGFYKELGINSYICSASDVDYFKIVVNSSVFVLYISEAEGYYGKDYDIYLYDSSYKEIAKSATRPLAGGVNIETIDYFNPSQGTYYIKVVGYNGAYATDSTYTLAVMFAYD